MTRLIKLSPKTTPLAHQIEAIDFLVNNKIAALLDEQGVGKTKEMIDAIIVMIRNNAIDSALIICPKTLMNTWKTEINKHSYLIPAVIEGSGTQKSSSILSSPNVYIINYEGVSSEGRILKSLLETEKFALILDESQRIKNPLSKTYGAIAKIQNLAVRRYILSGTIMANDPMDLWSQFHFLDGGVILGDNFKVFKNTYGLKKIKEEDLLVLRNLIRPISIRRLKTDVLELPDKNFINVSIQLAPEQNRIYKKLKKELKIEMGVIEGQTITDESNTILKKLLRLAQIASNPGLLVSDYDETPAKFVYIEKLVESIISNNDKVIIWSSYVDNVKILKKKFSKYGSLSIHGEVKISDRNRYVDLFQNDPNYRVLVANPSAAREGLTLTAANHAVYLDRNFNLVDYLQSQDRIHRISQNKPCNIYKLIAIDTIDEFIENRLSVKQNVAKVLQGDTAKLTLDDSLTKEEIERILR